MNADEKRCPYCDEIIKKSAKKCRFCGEWLEAPIESINVQRKADEVVSREKDEEASSIEKSVHHQGGNSIRVANRRNGGIKEKLLKINDEPKKKMGFLESLIICLKKYYKFSGRARVGEYWWFFLFCHIVLLIPIVLIIVGYIKLDESWYYYREWESIIGESSAFAIIWCVLTIVPLLAVTVRRLHDTATCGWYALMGLIVPMGNIVLMLNLLQNGTVGDNEYGRDPVLRS